MPMDKFKTYTQSELEDVVRKAVDDERRSCYELALGSVKAMSGQLSDAELRIRQNHGIRIACQILDRLNGPDFTCKHCGVIQSYAKRFDSSSICLSCAVDLKLITF